MSSQKNAIVALQRVFREEFGIDPPHSESIRRWIRQFKESGCLCNKKGLERPRASQEQLQWIFDAC